MLETAEPNLKTVEAAVDSRQSAELVLPVIIECFSFEGLDQDSMIDVANSLYGSGTDDNGNENKNNTNESFFFL